MPHSGLHAALSKSPELHSHDLENPAHPQPLVLKPLRLDSHFSYCPTGTTVFYLSLFILFPIRSAAFLDGQECPCSECRDIASQQWGPDGALFQPSMPRNPENGPCFPRDRQPAHGYNQEEQKTVVSVHLQRVVEWAGAATGSLTGAPAREMPKARGGAHAEC